MVSKDKSYATGLGGPKSGDRNAMFKGGPPGDKGGKWNEVSGSREDIKAKGSPNKKGGK